MLFPPMLFRPTWEAMVGAFPLTLFTPTGDTRFAWSPWNVTRAGRIAIRPDRATRLTTSREMSGRRSCNKVRGRYEHPTPRGKDARRLSMSALRAVSKRRVRPSRGAVHGHALIAEPARTPCYTRRLERWPSG